MDLPTPSLCFDVKIRRHTLLSMLIIFKVICRCIIIYFGQYYLVHLNCNELGRLVEILLISLKYDTYVCTYLNVFFFSWPTSLFPILLILKYVTYLFKIMTNFGTINFILLYLSLTRFFNCLIHFWKKYQLPIQKFSSDWYNL